MSEYISKSALVDHLNETAYEMHKSSRGTSARVILKLRDEIQSGHIDTPSKGIEEYYELQEKYREASQEIERLRARIAELEDVRGDYFDQEGVER